MFDKAKTTGGPNPYVSLPTPAKDAVVDLIRDLAGELALLGVTKVALFGSVARGEDTPESDIDIAVATVEPANFMIRVHVRDLVQTSCGRRADVVRLPLAYPLSATATEDLVDVI